MDTVVNITVNTPAPEWALDLLAAVEYYEDVHPKVEAGRDCLGDALAAVPAEVRAEARGWARARPSASGPLAAQVETAPTELALLTPEQFGKRVNVGRTTIYGLLASGEVRSVKVGRLRRIPAPEGDRFAAQLVAEQHGDGQ